MTKRSVSYLIIITLFLCSCKRNHYLTGVGWHFYAKADAKGAITGGISGIIGGAIGGVSGFIAGDIRNAQKPLTFKNKLDATNNF